MKVVVGVDTHKDSHAIVIVDSVGAVVSHTVIRASPEGYARAIAAAAEFDDVTWGIEGAGSQSSKNVTITTPMLGPVGGRIVAEVFLGLMFGDANSMLFARSELAAESGPPVRAQRSRSICPRALNGCGTHRGT